MTTREHTIAYPRRRLARGLARTVGRLILRLAFRIEITGRENFPSGGPLLVVGNHDAAMEGVLMAIFTPWQVELLGAGDLPQEKITEISERFYGYIPIRRGDFDRRALVKAVDVLRQGGVLGIFPEGGIWQGSKKRAQPGVAWLSHQGRAPVLPVAFGGTVGALTAALNFKRPHLTMKIGQLLPTAQPPERRTRKTYYQAFADQVMDAVHDLLPREKTQLPSIENERFNLEIFVHRDGNAPQPLPTAMTPDHPKALAKLLHRPGILKIFRANLNLPVTPLEELHRSPPPRAIAEAIVPILDYLDEENPYLLTYRFGPQEGEAMRLGLEELLDVARWAMGENLSLTVRPIRHYYDPQRNEEVVQIEQGTFEAWM